MNALSYSNGIGKIPLMGETIGQNLRRIVEKHGDKEALIVVSQNYRATYSQFWQQIEDVARALVAYDVKKGDRVGIWSANRFEWVLIQYATARIGAIMVNINPGYKETGLEYALHQSGVSLLIAAKGFRQTNYVEMLNHIRPHCPYPKRTIIIDNEWDKFIEKGKSIPASLIDEIEAELQFDDPVNIQYTSGTTGYPKGVTLTHHNILNNGFWIGERMYLTENDRICIPVPFYHCFGMVLGNMACTTHGSCMVIPGEFFDPEQTLRAVEKEKCTGLHGVPTMFIAELQLPNFSSFNLTSLRTGIMAGAPCPVEYMKAIMEKMNMTQVTISYGMTETSPVSTMTYADDPFDKRVATIGTVMPHIEVKIIDPNTKKIVPRGVAGELCTRGYSVMMGYWNNEADTNTVIDANRWMHTGDIATMDNEGYLCITGRIKDIIIRGGENISPREVEEFLMKHEAIVDIQVIGVPSDKYGEEVCAWVIPQKGYDISEEMFFKYCKGQLDTFKIPRFWKFVTEFPTTVTGKVRKVEMREISAKELGLDKIRSIHTSEVSE